MEYQIGLIKVPVSYVAVSAAFYVDVLDLDQNVIKIMKRLS